MMGLMGLGVLAVLGAVLFLIWQLRPEDNVQGQVQVALTMALLQETQNAVNVTQTALSDPALIAAGTEDVDAPPPLLDGTPATPTPILAGTENTTWTPVIESFNGLSMVFVPAGCTLMDDASNEVCVDGFWLGQMEITNAQYALCVASDSCAPPSDRRYFDDPAFADHPVVYVTWDDAQTYADWVGMQLPTVSQWEYAARGPEGWEYSWGNTSPTCELANIGGCGGGTAAVGSDIRTGGASWVGALDMIGNVREWLADAEGSQKMVRGGDWDTEQVRLVEADSADPASSDETLGFRIAALTAP
jgi:formylglycine-generating enzyme required for sulfatase activity